MKTETTLRNPTDAGARPRVTVLIEKIKPNTWSIGAYLITFEGYRERRSLGIFETYIDATKALKQAWEHVTL